MMAKEALNEGSGPFQIVVDSAVSATNVRRFLESRGYEVSTTEDPAGTFVLECLRPEEKKERLPEENRENHQSGSKTTLLVTSSTLGKGDDVLGEALLKAFVSTLAETGIFEGTVALMNSGVKLALAENSVSESLRLLEDKGCSVLVCGTCTDHYGITEQVSVGTISNMFEITEALLSADKTVTIP
jgi:selenium metabolism protein YedF